jgi:hypothetical protein
LIHSQALTYLLSAETRSFLTSTTASMDKELPSDAMDSSLVQAAPVLLAEDCSPTFRQRSHSLPSATALFSDGQHSAGIVDGIGTSWNHMVARWLGCYRLITTVCKRAAAVSRLVLRSRTAAMHLWRSSVEVVLRSARKFYSREILWSAVVADDPDQAFASLCDQGMLIEEIQIPVKAGDVASDSCPNSISWPRQAESISRSLPAPPVRIVIISDTHSQHARMTTVRAVLQRKLLLGFISITRFCSLCPRATF